MALSLDEVIKKKTKPTRVRSGDRKKRVTRPWEKSQVEQSSVQEAVPTKAGLFVRQMLKTAFEYKDKLMSSEQFQAQWQNATTRLQTVIEKNPQLNKTLSHVNNRFGVAEKVTQAFSLAKMVELEIRQKL